MKITFVAFITLSLQPKANFTASWEHQASQQLGLIMFGMLTVGSSCSFLYINVVLLFTLRSKQVFCETPRFILLYNLLFADSAHLFANLVLYLLAFLRMKITYYACGALILLSLFTISISPINLAIMSVERFVAVCYPLRYATVFTVRSTGLAIALTWAFSFVYILSGVFMFLFFHTKISLNLIMNDLCTKESFFLAPIFSDFEEVYNLILFLSVGAAIMASYVRVALVATSASKDKVSARKALWTLSLQMVQLSLTIVSTMFGAIMLLLTKTLGKSTVLSNYNICFVFLSILPRCLSALIYGFRDQIIRPVLLKNLLCCLKCTDFYNKRY